MTRIDSTVLDNTAVADSTYLLRFAWDGPPAAPGQFVTVRIGDGAVPLLRRPFAFAGCRDGEAEVVYEVRGDATRLLASAAPGAHIDVLGPLGNRFPPPESVDAVLVAGGIGLGPMRYLAAHIQATHVRSVFLIGARTAARLPRRDLLPGGDVRTATDDGSEGHRGTVLDLLRELPDSVLRESTVYACGPHPMLAAIAHLRRSSPGRTWVSMEQTMGCGVGACMGCAIGTTTGYKRVCTEGPVFDAREVVWT